MSQTPMVASYPDDVFLYYGDIGRTGYNKVSDMLEGKVGRATRACLILVTYGGDPDAAYRIARAFHHYYRNLEILIPDICKSAGTLLCIGAKKLVFGDRGELGPLDIQLSKPDEMFESMSGLDIIQALNALENQVLSSFRSYLVDIRGGSRIRTSLAADIAAKLADGFVAPIAAKIDPITLGEHQRAMQIAYDYGERLNKMAGSLKNGALVQLVSSYPSHGFVIDRKEAADLFKCVESPGAETLPLYAWAREILSKCPYPKAPLVIDVKQFANPDQGSSTDEPKQVPAAGEPGVQGEDSASNEAPESARPRDEQDAGKPARRGSRKGS